MLRRSIDELAALCYVQRKETITIANALRVVTLVSLRATERPALSPDEGSVAIRHAVSLRGTFASLSIDSAEAISPRFLASLGMTFQVRLIQSLRSFAMTRYLMRSY